MARKDYVYFEIPKEMAQSLQTILNKEGKKHAIESRSELIRRVLSDLIGYYENDVFFKAKIASKAFLGEEEIKHKKTSGRNPQLLL